MLNEHAVISGNTTVRTAFNSGRMKPFNPFTNTPMKCPQGNTAAQCIAMNANWQKGDNFGKPTGVANYQIPRTYRLSLGFKF